MAMWVFVCGVFDLCFSVDPWAILLVQISVALWMNHGAYKLNEGGWRSSYGRDGPVWILKDSLTLMLWPIMYRWIVHRGEIEK
jgi:hypothetical protein